MIPEQLAEIEQRPIESLNTDAPYNADVWQLAADRDALVAEVKRLTDRVRELEATPVDWDAQRRRADQAERERDEALAVIEVRDHEHEQLETRHRAFLGAGARLETQLREARAALDRVRMVRAWKNEDGKAFVFADDLRAALDGSGT